MVTSKFKQGLRSYRFVTHLCFMIGHKKRKLITFKHWLSTITLDS